LVPGLGATLRGHSLEGLAEATVELGTFYGGLFGTHEGRFTIDGSIRDADTQASFDRAVTGQILQQVGLKLHFWDTFYHYQQATIEREKVEGVDDNPQALWRGDWKDNLSAPFKWKNISNPWSYTAIIAATGFLLLDYSSAQITPINARLNGKSEAYYGVDEMISIPVGSSFGEDPFFHGFVEREIRGATKSVWMASIGPAVPFALLHEDRLTAFIVGTYYGFATSALGGDLGPVMASHFWVNVFNGLLGLWSLKRSEGKPAPFNPPLAAQLKFAF
jgi:membrane protease YdiL (CAAX protease family)